MGTVGNKVDPTLTADLKKVTQPEEEDETPDSEQMHQGTPGRHPNGLSQNLMDEWNG